MIEMENIKNEFMLARLAMAIDCEGSILVDKYRDDRRRTGVRYYIYVAVYNTCEEFIDWLVTNFGFSKHNQKSQNKSHKPRFIAYTSRAKAEDILWGVRPYLLIKSELAELALDMQETMSRNRGRNIVPDDVLAKRERIWLAAKKLNRKGRHPE